MKQGIPNDMIQKENAQMKTNQEEKKEEMQDK